MDYSQLRNFKLRYFILFAIIISITSFILFFIFATPASEQWVTFAISICCLAYMLYQSKKWQFTYTDQPIAMTMTKGRWARYLSITACFQIITVVLTTIGLSALYLVLEEQIRSGLDFIQYNSLEIVETPFIVYILFFINSNFAPNYLGAKFELLIFVFSHPFGRKCCLEGYYCVVLH